MGVSDLKSKTFSGVRDRAVLPPALCHNPSGHLGDRYRLGAISGLFFPAPSFIFTTFTRLVVNGKLFAHLGATFLRVVLGFGMGGISGMILGLAMGWSPRWRAFFDPLIAAAHPVPKIATLPLIMVLLGHRRVLEDRCHCHCHLLPDADQHHGWSKTDSQPIHFEVAQNYGAPLIKTFTRVVWPGSLPMASRESGWLSISHS